MNFLLSANVLNLIEPSQTIILPIQVRTTIVPSSPIVVASLHFLCLEGRPPYCLVSELGRFKAPRDCLREGVRQVEATS
jgi:hypothetical protein